MTSLLCSEPCSFLCLSQGPTRPLVTCPHLQLFNFCYSSPRSLHSCHCWPSCCSLKMPGCPVLKVSGYALPGTLFQQIPTCLFLFKYYLVRNLSWWPFTLTLQTFIPAPTLPIFLIRFRVLCTYNHLIFCAFVICVLTLKCMSMRAQILSG